MLSEVRKGRSATVADRANNGHRDARRQCLCHSLNLDLERLPVYSDLVRVTENLHCTTHNGINIFQSTTFQRMH